MYVVSQHVLCVGDMEHSPGTGDDEKQGFTWDRDKEARAARAARALAGLGGLGGLGGLAG